MNNQAFDEQVREAVKNIGTDYKPETWDLLEQRLNTILPENENLTASAEEQFDAVIREKIANRKPDYNPNHWIIMSSILDEYQSVRAWLARYRVLETGLTALFLITFVNVFHIPVQFSNLTFKTQNNNNTEVAFENLQTLPLITKAKNSISAIKTEQNFTPTKRTEQKIVTIEKRVEELTTTFNVAPIVFKQLLEQPQLLPALPIASLEKNIDNSLIINSINIKKHKLKYSIGLATSTDINNIFTPELYSFGTLISAFTQTRYNFNAGFLMDLKKNRWSLETGLIYGKKSYSPADVRQDLSGTNVSTSAYKEDLASIKVNILQVPTMLHFDFIKRNRWDMYLAVGATTNFISEAKYDYSRQFIGYMSRPVAPLEPSAVVPASLYNDGILVTKSMIGNVFFTTNIGLGATYRLTPKFGLYSQMIYRNYFSPKGIGPNEDKISTTSLLFGFKKEF